ncbi:MAG: hypothetical protein WCB14_15680 [Candidatus Acidiferrales bacterium]
MAEVAKSSVVEMKDDSRFRANTLPAICKVYLTLASIADGFQGMCRRPESDVPCKLAARRNSARLQNRETQEIAGNRVQAALEPTPFI